MCFGGHARGAGAGKGCAGLVRRRGPARVFVKRRRHVRAARGVFSTRRRTSGSSVYLRDARGARRERRAAGEHLDRRDVLVMTSGLQSLEFGGCFNQSLDNTALPSGLQSLTFCFKFTQSLDKIALPSGLQSLTFGSEFNQRLELDVWL